MLSQKTKIQTRSITMFTLIYTTATKITHKQKSQIDSNFIPKVKHNYTVKTICLPLHKVNAGLKNLNDLWGHRRQNRSE